MIYFAKQGGSTMVTGTYLAVNEAYSLPGHDFKFYGDGCYAHNVVREFSFLNSYTSKFEKQFQNFSWLIALFVIYLFSFWGGMRVQWQCYRTLCQIQKGHLAGTLVGNSVKPRSPANKTGHF